MPQRLFHHWSFSNLLSSLLQSLDPLMMQHIVHKFLIQETTLLSPVLYTTRVAIAGHIVGSPRNRSSNRPWVHDSPGSSCPLCLGSWKQHFTSLAELQRPTCYRMGAKPGCYNAREGQASPRPPDYSENSLESMEWIATYFTVFGGHKKKISNERTECEVIKSNKNGKYVGESKWILTIKSNDNKTIFFEVSNIETIKISIIRGS